MVITTNCLGMCRDKVITFLKKKAPGVFDYGGRVVYMSCVHGGGVYIQWAIGCSDKSTPLLALGWGYILRLKPNIVTPLFSSHDCTLFPHSTYVRHHCVTYNKTNSFVLSFKRQLIEYF